MNRLALFALALPLVIGCGKKPTSEPTTDERAESRIQAPEGRTESPITVQKEAPVKAEAPKKAQTEFTASELLKANHLDETVTVAGHGELPPLKTGPTAKNLPVIVYKVKGEGEVRCLLEDGNELRKVKDWKNVKVRGKVSEVKPGIVRIIACELVS